MRKAEKRVFLPMPRVCLFLLLTALFTVRAGLFASLQVTGEDGWNVVLTVQNPGQVKKPVFLVITGSGETNSFLWLDARDKYVARLETDDGSYRYSVFDADKRVIEKGEFVLKTPFNASFRRIAADFVEMEIRTDGRIELNYYLELTNRKMIDGTTNISGTTRLRFDRLAPSSLYRLTVRSGTYTRKVDFITGPANVALNRPVFGTFNRLPASRYVDDTTPAMTRVNDGKWEWLGGMAASGEVDSEEQYVYVNLGRVCRLKTVIVVWHADYYPLTYYFVYGKDGKKWNVIERNEKNYIKRVASDNTPVRIDEIRTNLEAATIGVIIKKGEKIKSRFASRNYVELLEIEANE